VLGVDPGTNAIGFALLEQAGSRLSLVEAGVIRAPRGAPLQRRLRVIHEGLLDVLRRTRPAVAVVEQVFYGKSVRDALKIGEGRGVALLAAGISDLPVAEYAPAQVKKAATGNGRARKSQVQEMVRRILGLEERPPQDAADAIAIALCHCHQPPLGESRKEE
jgi:crossover junction endodeoxyribonuclease RuvC